MKNPLAFLILILTASAAFAQSSTTISGLPNANPFTIQSGDYVPIVRGGVTYKATLWAFPNAGNIILSNGTGISATSLAETDGYCVQGVNGSWAVEPCVTGASITGSPSSSELAVFSSDSSITNGDLTGDCTTDGSVVTTCEKSNGVTIVTTTGTQTLTNKSISGSEIDSGTVAATYLPQASSSSLGIVQGDGSTLTINGSGVASCTTATSGQIGCSKPDNSTITASAGALTVANTTVAGQTCTPGSTCGFTDLTNSISSNVSLSSTSSYFDGPSVAQGSSGTWFVSGTITITDTSTTPNIKAKLWDGTTVIDSAVALVPIANSNTTITLSGVITNPAGNLKISANDPTGTTGEILFNASGNSKDSTITAMRIK